MLFGLLQLLIVHSFGKFALVTVSPSSALGGGGGGGGGEKILYALTIQGKNNYSTQINLMHSTDLIYSFTQTFLGQTK